MHTRDENGHPLQGQDTVPARRRPLVNLTNLLQDANDRNDRLFEQVQTWKAAYNHLQAEHAALKYAHLCSSCQLQRVTAEPGQTLELTCTACQRLPDTVQTLKRDLDTKTRDAAFWQACYETLLGESYGRGGDDGAHQGLRQSGQLLQRANHRKHPLEQGRAVGHRTAHDSQQPVHPGCHGHPNGATQGPRIESIDQAAKITTSCGKTSSTNSLTPSTTDATCPLSTPQFFTRHPATKQLKVSPRTKQYGLVFDKRVVDPNTFQSFPYGYTPGSDQDVDMRNVDMLLTL